MQAVNKQKPRILLIDDEERIVNFLSLKLKVSGYDVVCARDGKKGLEMVINSVPDMILLDIIMPGIDGFEVLRQLRRFSNVPVIVLSAKEHITKEVLALGANSCMSKPFNPDDLISRIKLILSQPCH